MKSTLAGLGLGALVCLPCFLALGRGALALSGVLTAALSRSHLLVMAASLSAAVVGSPSVDGGSHDAGRAPRTARFLLARSPVRDGWQRLSLCGSGAGPLVTKVRTEVSAAS